MSDYEKIKACKVCIPQSRLILSIISYEKITYVQSTFPGMVAGET